MNRLKFAIILLFFTTNINLIYAQSNDESNDANFSGYNNFDFVPGKKVIFYDDFSNALSKWKVIEFDAADDVEKPGIKKITNDEYLWFKTPKKAYSFH
ncbi:MAG: hypothetical protein UZ11_BCD004001999 [Bacteroidetes bacterium OLB11]|nr:MAG: hypothetical protein UZ11_BCD004001999 [Bacteroidetes bacterium OLB11]